jgi:HAD superfamily hydrolase (TIGR01509 family)
MSRVPTAVLFDLDGTLLDSEHLWLESELEVMKSLESDWTVVDQRTCLGGPLDRVAAYMVQRSGTSHNAGYVGDLLLRTMEANLRVAPLRWRPGARDFLQATIDSGIPRALVTSSWAVLVAAVADRISLEFGTDPFTAVVAGDHIVNGKPHPEPYLRAAELLGTSPERCLAIEDSPTGVKSAAAAGCVVVAIPHLAPLPPDLSDLYVVDSLEGTDPVRLWEQALAHGR